MRHARLTLALLAVALVAFPASGHTTVPAADGSICLTVGSLNEPVSTYVQSGLDLIVRENNDPGGDCASADRGEEIPDFHNLIASAVVVSPSGAERDIMPIQTQFGQVGRYTSSEPYQWTEPGQYRLRLEGTYQGAAFDGTYDIAGAVASIEDTYHPELPSGATIGDLQARVDALASRLADTEAELAQAQQRLTDIEEAQADADAERARDNGAAASPLAWLAAAVAAVAMWIRRRG